MTANTDICILPEKTQIFQICMLCKICQNLLVFNMTPKFKDDFCGKPCLSLCVFEGVCVRIPTLSLSSVFWEVREAMEMVSGWLLASP